MSTRLLCRGAFSAARRCSGSSACVAEISRPIWMTTASFSARPVSGRRCRTMSIVAGSSPTATRLHLVQRPLVGLVVLARRGQNRQLGQGAPERRGPAHVGARHVQSDRCCSLDSGANGGRRLRETGSTSGGRVEPRLALDVVCAERLLAGFAGESGNTLDASTRVTSTAPRMATSVAAPRRSLASVGLLYTHSPPHTLAAFLTWRRPRCTTRVRTQKLRGSPATQCRLRLASILLPAFGGRRTRHEESAVGRAQYRGTRLPGLRAC